MNINIELYAPDFKRYDVKLLTHIAQETIIASNVINCDDVDITISVAVVDKNEIQRINKKFCGKDVVTDVLSIGDYSDNNDISLVKEKQLFLGEVILCYNHIERSADENNVGVDQEFFTVYSHGILHLLGFVHGKKMFQLQDAVSAKFCRNR